MTGTHEGRLVVLVGPSGSGKTTLARQMIDARPERWTFSVSHTTRERRPTEVTGRDYHFVDRAAFERLRDADGFAEWAEVHGNLYGTSMAELDHHFAAGREVFFDIDILGAHNIWRRFTHRSRLIFVLPPTWSEMVGRLERRGTETDATLRRRLRTARIELLEVLASPAPWSILVNDDLETATADLVALIDGADNVANGAGSPLVQAFLAAAIDDPRSLDRHLSEA